MFDPPIDISYRTSVDERREGPLGTVLQWFGNHPIWGGLICGVVVVLIAGLRRPEGVQAAPTTAGLISLAVVIVWMILFFLMRGFFEAQSFVSRSVVRRLVVQQDRARWLQDDEPLRELEDPRLRLLTNPVPEGLVDEQTADRDATAWPIWIVFEDETNDGQRLIFETRDAAGRARDYGDVDDTVVEETDERLPRAIAAPILQRWTLKDETSNESATSDQ